VPEEKNRGGASHDSQHPTPAEKRVEAFGNQSALGLELPLTMAGAVIFVCLLGYADRGGLHLVLWHGNLSSVTDEFLWTSSLRPGRRVRLNARCNSSIHTL